jgi:hypothetical protein
MRRPARLASLLLVAAAALGAAGCFNKEEQTTLGETEGIYVTVDDLKYQVQISRILDPASAEDSAYLHGVPATEGDPGQDEVWFAVFMRVENDSDAPHATAEEFVIKDTQDNEFEPVELDAEANLYVYEPEELQPGKLMPELDSPAADNTIRGRLLLYKLKTESLGNRPVELEIASPTGGEGAVIDLDI